MTIGSYDHQVGYPKMGVLYEPTDKMSLGSLKYGISLFEARNLELKSARKQRTEKCHKVPTSNMSQGQNSLYTVQSGFY